MFHIPNPIKAVAVLVALVILGVLLVQLFGSQAGPPATPSVLWTPVAQATSTPPPYPPPGSPTPPGPSVIPTVNGPTPIPRCAFAAAPAPTGSGASLDRFAFSEPRVVLTHTAAIGIASWLPDGEQLLIVRDFRDSDQQSIETFNVHTGELHTYARRRNNGTYLLWLPHQQAVAYLDREYMDEAQGQFRYDLWISRGKSGQVQRLVEGVSPIFLTVDSSDRLIYFPQAANDPQVLDVATGHTQALPLALARWQYPQYPQAVLKPSTFQIAWQPEGPRAVLFAYPWTLLFDTRTNQACAVDLGQTTPINPIWVLQARWSPDGRYLALVTIDTRPGQLVRSAELVILDLETGSLRTLQPAPDRHGVTSIAWAPDSRYLAVLGVVYMDEDRVGERRGEGVFIVDAATGAVQPGPSDYDIGGGSPAWQLAWSSDGSQLAVGCPTAKEGRLCIIALKTKGAQE